MKKVMVGTTAEGGADAALVAAARLAAAADAELVVLEVEPALDARRVFDPAGVPAGTARRSRVLLDFPGVRVSRRRVRGNAVRTMCEAAEAERPDLIVVPHGRAATGETLLSRRASRNLVARASCPVLLVAS